MLRDAAQPVYDHFLTKTHAELAKCDAQRMAAMHRVAPYEPHPDELSRMLNVYRSRATLGKYVIVKLPTGSGWSLARLASDRDEGSVVLEAEVYASVADAEHAVLLARLGEENPSGGAASA